MIGYNRTVKLRWLDETVDLFLAGLSDAEIYGALSDRLKGELSVGSTAERGSREKAIALLMKTWVRVPPTLRPFRQDAARLLQGVRRSERLPFHWGMTMAVYPFWRVVADITGRLFRLQGTVAPAQVQRRAKELFGEREVVARSARYVLRAFSDWGVIIDSDRKGEYSPATMIKIADARVTNWLLEAAALSASDGSSDFDSLVKSPSLFPFQLGRVFPDQLLESGRLDVVRHGLESTLVRVLTTAQHSPLIKKNRSHR
jgi:hypothetical protein